jgi:hypothetical protein
LNPKHFSGHRLFGSDSVACFFLLPAMRSPSDADSCFLAIALHSITHGILSIDGDCALISIARKNRDHGSPSSKKKHKPLKNQKIKNPKNTKNQ